MKTSSWALLLAGPVLGTMLVTSCGSRTALNDPGEGIGGIGGGGGQDPKGGGGSTSTYPTTTTTLVTTGTLTTGSFTTGTLTTGSFTTGTFSTTTSTGTGGFGGGTTNRIISETPDGFLEAETHIAVSPQNVVSVAWIDIPGAGPSAIGYAFSTDDGASFLPPASIQSPGGRLAGDPVLAVDPAGNFYLVWVGYFQDPGGDTSDMHVYVSKAPAGSTSFGPAVEVSIPQADALYDKPWITFTNKGALIVTWAAATNQSYSLLSARSTDALNWTRAVIADDPTFQIFRNLAFPCAPPTGDRIYVTYLNFTGGIDVGLAHSDNDGLDWSAQKIEPVNLFAEMVAFDDPNCVADGNDVWVSYGLTPDATGQRESDKSDIIRVARSADQGVSIQSRIDVHDPVYTAFIHPQMTREPDTGALDFTYYVGDHNDDPGGSFRRSRAPDPALPPQPSQVVEFPVFFTQARSNPRWLGDYTGLTYLNGKVYMAYAVNTSGASHIAFAKHVLSN